jgi:hypothetical protein
LAVVKALLLGFVRRLGGVRLVRRGVMAHAPFVVLRPWRAARRGGRGV